ncbi:MAG: PIG-L family deacetylase [Chloroflexi bacterium]|nr:PIG-L family deacetylase [Chloroflexota bacterium]
MKILVFSAHSADFCSRAGGTLAKCARAGAQVRVVALTYGERSESGGLFADGARPPLDEVRAIRHKEATRAAAILGVDIAFLDWGDLSLEPVLPRTRALSEEIRAFQPDVLLTHHGPDPNSVDHEVTWQLVRRARQLAATVGLESPLPIAKPMPLFLFEATLPLTEVEGFAPDFYIDITSVWEQKVEALTAFARAQSFLVPWYTEAARSRGRQAATISGHSEIVYAEAFERTLPWVGDTLPL